MCSAARPVASSPNETRWAIRSRRRRSGRGSGQRKDLVLTIDKDIQYQAAAPVGRHGEEVRRQVRLRLVMDPRDGSILAMPSIPTFRPQRAASAGEAIRNKASWTRTKPGSTVKAMTASGRHRAGPLSLPSRCSIRRPARGRKTIHEAHGTRPRGLESHQDRPPVEQRRRREARPGAGCPSHPTTSAIRPARGRRVDFPGEARGAGCLRNGSWVASTSATSVTARACPSRAAARACTRRVANKGMLTTPHFSQACARGPTLQMGWGLTKAISPKDRATMTEVMRQVVFGRTGSQAAGTGLRGWRQDRSPRRKAIGRRLREGRLRLVVSPASSRGGPAPTLVVTIDDAMAGLLRWVGGRAMFARSPATGSGTSTSRLPSAARQRHGS